MAQKNDQNNTECRSELHNQHLCYFISQGFHLTDEQKYNDMVSEQRFKCRHCGRVARDANNLCEPTEL